MKKAKKMKVEEVSTDQINAMKGILTLEEMQSCTSLREKEDLVKQLLALYTAHKEAVDAAVAAM